jgi:glycosyltransferase involved in cell wall biosynthesis
LPFTQGPEVSVVVLCYRAEEDALRVLEPLYETLEASSVPYELVLVANYWPHDEDRTRDVVESFACDRPTVRTVARRKEGDMGWDMRSGLEQARGETLVVIDGDGQVPPEYALQVYRELKRTGADIAKGRRYSREDGFIRSVNSVAYNVAFRLLFGTRGLWDINGRPKALTRSAYRQLALTTDDWFTDAEIVLKARQLGLRIHEVPVRFLRNSARDSFVGLRTVWEFARNMLLWRLGRHGAQRVRRDESRSRSLTARDRSGRARRRRPSP